MVKLAPLPIASLHPGDEVLDPAGKRLHRKWLGQYVHARVEVPEAEHGILGIAGDEQYLQPRPRQTLLSGVSRKKAMSQFRVT